MPLEKQVQILLFYLGHGIQYRLVTLVLYYFWFFLQFSMEFGSFYFMTICLQIADRFNLSESMVFQAIEDLCTVLVEKMMPLYIKWLASEAQERTADFFEDAYGFEGVIGCIDGMHIPVHKPLYCPQDYYTRKQVYAIQLQAVCDEHLMFTHIFAGFCGGSHDSYVLQNSQLYLDHSLDIKKWFSEPEYHLVGDCAYPLMSYLLKPFPKKEGMSKRKKLYNKSLSGCRHTIERAFGLLKNKWKILTFPWTHDPHKLTLVTGACCVLHNFCLVHGGAADVHDFVPPSEGNTAVSHESDAAKQKNAEEEFVMTSTLAIKWHGVGLDGKDKESRILKRFEKS